MIVAIDGPDDMDNFAAESHIVGYAVTQGSRVVELCCSPDYGSAALRLLTRTCRDAIEHNCRTISIHTPASDPLHELIVTAGGHWCAEPQASDGTLLVKLLDPARWIEATYLEIQRREACRIGTAV